MTPLDRLLIAIMVLAAGALVGYLIRRRLQPDGPARGSVGLPAGLVVVSAPYCTRCTTLQGRLASRVEFETIDAARRPALVAELDVKTAPTVLAIDEAGRITDREHRNFSDARLNDLARAANKEPG